MSKIHSKIDESRKVKMINNLGRMEYIIMQFKTQTLQIIGIDKCRI